MGTFSERGNSWVRDDAGISHAQIFFNVRDGLPIIKENTGIELPDLAAAIEVARKEAIMVVSALRSQPELLKGLKVHVSDEHGNVLEKVDLPDIQEFAT